MTSIAQGGGHFVERCFGKRQNQTNERLNNEEKTKEESRGRILLHGCAVCSVLFSLAM